MNPPPLGSSVALRVGGERKFSETTRYQKKTKCIASLICSVILFIYFHNLFSSSWWKIATHLTWSLLDLSEELTPLKSADYLSETLAHLLYAGYLVLALILLINMLIALLSNTYQRVQVRIQLLKGYFSRLFNQSNYSRLLEIPEGPPNWIVYFT